LQRIINIFNETAKKYVIKINVNKTKEKKISKNEGSLKKVIDGQEVEQVNEYISLRVLISNDGRCDTEIRTRIEMAKDAFSKKK